MASNGVGVIPKFQIMAPLQLQIAYKMAATVPDLTALYHTGQGEREPPSSDTYQGRHC